MRINVLSCTGTSGGERFLQEIASRVQVDLMRFGGRISYVDVLILDDVDDAAEEKACVMEAGVRGIEPVAVQAQAETFEHAVDVGTEKLASVLSNAISELQNAETVDYQPENSAGD